MKDKEKVDASNKAYNLSSPKHTHRKFTDGLQRLNTSVSRVETIISKVLSFQKIVSEQIKPLIGVAGKVVEFTKSIDWEQVEERWVLIAENTGENGWTIPLNMNLDTIFSLTEIKNKEEIDKMFTDFFANQENYLSMKNDILANESLQDFHALLVQCFDSYERENFLIAIPSLFSIVEGYANELIIDQFKKTSDYNPKKRVSLPTKYKQVQKQNDSSFKDIVYISALIFLEKSFDQNAFNDDPLKDNRPLIINRHRVLHGRDNPALWTKVDAICLFNAIATLSSLEVPEIKKINKT